MKAVPVPARARGGGARLDVAVRLGGAAVFLTGFSVYLATLAPTITFWDSGELVLGAYSLGNPHPPAYPLFCMTGKLFTLLPLGSVAYRMNLMSAAFGASSVWLLYRLVREMGGEGAGPSLVACALSLAFGFMPSFWGVSATTEVYTINAFLLAMAALLVMRHAGGGGEAYLHASAFALGLALVNHQSVVLFLPAYAAYRLLSDKGWKKPVQAVASASFFLFGYSTILYLPVRAASRPVINVGDPVTFDNFSWLIRWPDNFRAARGAFFKMSQMFEGGRLFLVIFALVILLGVLYLIFRKERFLALSILSSLSFFAGIGALSYGAEAVKKWGLDAKFYIPAFLFLVPVAAWAVYRVTETRPGGTRGQGGAAAFVGVLLLAIPATLAYRGYAGADNTRNYFAYDFAVDTLRPLRQDAALFGWGDNGVFPAWYLQGVERYRDDVLYMHTELLTYGWYMDWARGEMRERYGVDHLPEFRLTELEKNQPGIEAALTSKAPTYLDFSAVWQLKIPWDRVRPQGLVYMRPGPSVMPNGEMWDGVTARAAKDPEANRAFAVEGVLDIYGFQCYRWGADACYQGLLNEAEESFALCEALAPGTYTSRCASKGKVEDLRKDKGKK